MSPETQILFASLGLMTFGILGLFIIFRFGFARGKDPDEDS